MSGEDDHSYRGDVASFTYIVFVVTSNSVIIQLSLPICIFKLFIVVLMILVLLRLVIVLIRIYTFYFVFFYH